MTEDQPHRVVVIGGGFGGLQAVHGFRRADVEVTLIDRRNFHLFQPLSYQVATGARSSAEVCFPLRWIFRRRKDVRVLMALIALAYRPFGQACCRTGKRAASLGAEALSYSTPDLRSADLHLTVIGPQYRKAIACPTTNLT